MKLKAGVSLKNLQPQTAVGMAIADSVFRNHGTELVVTAGSDGEHMAGSLHYIGLAFDARIRDVPERQRAVLLVHLREVLGAEWDVVLEADHIHLEWDPA